MSRLIYFICSLWRAGIWMQHLRSNNRCYIIHWKTELEWTLIIIFLIGNILVANFQHQWFAHNFCKSLMHKYIFSHVIKSFTHDFMSIAKKSLLLESRIDPMPIKFLLSKNFFSLWQRHQRRFIYYWQIFICLSLSLAYHFPL